MSKLLNETKVLLTNVRLSYPHIFEPYAFEGQSEKYSASLIISKDDKESLAIIKEAISGAMEVGESKLKGKSKKAIRIPLRDGDTDRAEDPAYENSFFINANSTRAPQVVALYADPKTKKPVFLDEEDVYPGCYVNVTINFFAYNTSGNVGIGAGLGNIQKYDDGERFGSATSAESDFEFDDLPESSIDDDDVFPDFLS
ncbi:MAG: DUF2815 family protein [Clostridia bacterium]|nr:DUF2815 family protein [Clostridia bacterium]